MSLMREVRLGCSDDNACKPPPLGGQRLPYVRLLGVQRGIDGLTLGNACGCAWHIVSTENISCHSYLGGSAPFHPIPPSSNIYHAVHIVFRNAS